MREQEKSTVSLEDRYVAEEGRVYLNGLQALVRLPLDQNRRDRRSGLRIGTFISGFPGSPLGSYDLALKQAGTLLQSHDIVHRPATNEEMAATAIRGTQMLDDYRHERFDGVVGIWYGKGPGVDRSGDALKHGNFAGTSRHGAVVVLSGEDHEAKSSTLPYQDDYAFVSAGMPILYPASTGEFLELGLHAVALSRYSGCWVAMKLVGPLADGGETVTVSRERPSVVYPELSFGNRPFQKSTDFTFFPGTNIETERRIYYERHTAALAYARANGLGRIERGSANDRIGIVSAGKSYADTCQALLDMGLDEAERKRLGIGLLRLGMIYPLDHELLRDFAGDLDEIIVIEEKRGFVEAQVKEALCGLLRTLRVVGKCDENGAPLFPIQGGMDSDMVAERLGPRLLRHIGSHEGIRSRLATLQKIRSRRYERLPPRTPNYCSGCPHNSSTRLLDDQLAWGSPGCHSFAAIIEQPERHIVSMTQLGGEGLPWIGLQPFTEHPHMVQNVGDGSLFHSSYLNIRFALAAGANITFKILYNGYIANTGAQESVGGRSIPELTRLLETEGVKRIAVVTKYPKAYRRADLAKVAQIYPLEDNEAVLKELAREGGVTVYIYDGMCANEQRRRQRRGLLPVANEFVVINPDVCENCGHCGMLTNCMSLHKMETEFGEKTQIHPSSCNQDYTCLGGDCPSFVTVETKEGTGYRKFRPPPLAAATIPAPRQKMELARPYHIYIPGVGGTGVITVNALLAYAALMEGKRVLSYDQTGAAQKWGPVLSSLVVADDGQAIAANKVGAGKADLYLAFDLMAGSSPVNLDRCDPEHTAAVINTTLFPSGEMIRNSKLPIPVGEMKNAIARFTRPERAIFVEARRLAEALFGDYMATNIFTLGVAYQSGLLPLAAESIEAAIRLNGVEVDQNLLAFRYGRLQIADLVRVQEVVNPPGSAANNGNGALRAGLSARYVEAYDALIERCMGFDEEARHLLETRVAELIDYQNPDYAAAYVDFVLHVAEREKAVATEKKELTHAVIRYLYKLMAYKDEYEVARLHLKESFHHQIAGMFAEPARLVHHFHPPLLRAMGLKKKLRFGPWFIPVLQLLRSLRSARGTPFDPFTHTALRRQERALIGWYRGLVEAALHHLNADSYADVVALAKLPDLIRGYEQIKIDAITAVKAQATQALAQLDATNRAA